MKSEDLKVSMVEHCLYRLGCNGAVTEYGGKGSGGIADVYAITRAGYSIEFEIKVNKQDLLGELNAIDYIKNEHLGIQPRLEDGPREQRYTGKNYSKATKHWSYLAYDSEYKVKRCPNQFYFFVTLDLLDLAKERLKDTPYGLYVLRGTPECVKKADKLHREKVPEDVLINMLRKASNEILYARTAQQVLRNELNSKK